MTSSERKSRKTRLLILMAGAVLMSMVLAFSAAPAARAGSITPDPLGVTQIAPPQVHKATGQFVAEPTNAIVMHKYVQSSYKGGVVPNDAPFGPNVRVTTDANADSRPSMVVQPGTGYLWVAYQNFNGADWDVVVDVSVDGGSTWNNVLATVGTGNEINPSLAVTSSSAFVLTWQDDANTNVLPFANSYDAGVTWSAWTLNINAVLPELSQIEFPSVVSQRVVGSYPDGIMFQMGAWCNDPGNCESGAHNIFWVGEQNANQDVSGWSFALGNSYWLVSAAPGGTYFVTDPRHPSAWWGGSDYTQAMDQEYTDGVEWQMLWIFISEDGTTPTNGYYTNAISDDGTYGAGAENGMNAIVAGTFRMTTAPTRHQILYFYTTDGWNADVNGAWLDAAVTDQRSISVAAPPGAMTDFHITYYSDLVMSDMIVDTTGGITGPQKVSDNAGTAVNDDRSTSVYVDDSGAPNVAWQDNRGGNTDIYIAGYISWNVWINATCGGVATPLALLLDGNPITTPWTGKWADGTTHILQAAPGTQVISACKRCIFNRWEDGSTNPLRTGILADRALSLEAIFNDQYAVNFLTNPPGLDVVVKGTRRTTPYTYWEAPGNYPADAPSPQPGLTPDQQYVFDDWLDGILTAARTYDVVAPSCTNLTANFHIQYQVTIATIPAGVGLMVGYDTMPMAIEPVTFWADPGSAHMLITKSPQPTSPTDTRYKFFRWLAPGPNTWGWNITVSAAATYTASFDTQYKIQIQSNIPGPQLNIDIGDCTPVPPAPGPMECWETANSNPTIMLTPTQTPVPGSQYVFTQWIDGNLNPVRSIGPVTGPATYMSMWTAQYFLTMQLDSNCQGTLTPASGWHPYGDIVSIDWTAPATGTGERWMFDHWEGSGTGSYTGTNKASSVTMSGVITETAFCRHEYQVTVTTSPAGRGFEADGMAWTGPHVFWWEYFSQHYINITSTTQVDPNPETRYVFTGWADGNPNANRPPYTVTDTATLTANFKTQHHITLSQVPSSPAGLGGLQCNGAADCWFDQGTSPVVSVVSPYPTGAQYIRYVFQQWSGDASGTAQSFTFASLNAPKTATANWVIWYKVTVTSAQGNPACSNTDCWYSSGSSATITLTSPFPTAASGTRYVFTSWTVDATGTSNPLTITVDSPKNVTAGWKTQYELTIVSNCGSNVDCGVPTGAGWYDSAANADATVTSPYTDPSGKIWDFSAWSGASVETTMTTTVTMDAAKTVTATWTERAPPPAAASDMMLWLIIIIIIIVVVVLVLILMMKRKKPAPEEEELPPEEVPPAPPAPKSGGSPPPPKK